MRRSPARRTHGTDLHAARGNLQPMPSEGTEGTSMTVHRSWLFVPGDDERKLARAGTSGADALHFDLEDAVVPARRDAARGRVADVLASPAAGGGRLVRHTPARKRAV